MKSFPELTKLAIEAHSSNTDRAEFLAALEPEDRSNAAMQFDRASRLKTERDTPATDDEIATESRRIAVGSRLVEYCSEYSNYGPELLKRILSGRIMSEGMRRQADTAHEYSNLVSDEEIAAARPKAIENLNMEREYLAARLGLTE